MAMTKDKIKAELKKQQEIEGYTPDIALLFKILDMVKWQFEWKAATVVQHHRYGKLSYETHRFYYPSPLVAGLQQIFTNEVEWQGQ